MSQAAQVGHAINDSHLLHFAQGYYGDRRYYRDEEYEDGDAIDEDIDDNANDGVDDEIDDSVDNNDRDTGDDREEYASPAPAPPSPPPYRPYRHKPPYKKWGPHWTPDGKLVWRSDKFTPEFCYMCLGTCGEGRSCAPRCWGWRRYCRKHDL
jgi:hypothetical protein